MNARRLRLDHAAITGFDLRRYIAKETAIGIAVNSFVSTVPRLIFTDFSAGAIIRPVREVAISLTPQFFMAAFMSALVPLLLICRKQSRGRLGISPAAPRLQPGRAAVIALGLATASTCLTLALIHLLLAPLAAGGIGAGAILALGGVQAALAAAAVTPAAILLLLGTTRMRGPDVAANGTGPAPVEPADRVRYIEA